MASQIKQKSRIVIHRSRSVVNVRINTGFIRIITGTSTATQKAIENETSFNMGSQQSIL